MPDHVHTYSVGDRVTYVDTETLTLTQDDTPGTIIQTFGDTLIVKWDDQDEALDHLAGELAHAY